MNCPNCGSELTNDAKFCSVCGSPAPVQNNAAENAAPNYQNQTPNYQDRIPNYQNPAPNYQYAPPNANPKSRLLAGVFGILLGGIGVHNFYLGNTTRGVIQIVVSCVTCGVGAIWGFVEGILILCRQINTDAYGIPLKDDC